jgi:ADP-heptose:LPS heptosyltransferase
MTDPVKNILVIRNDKLGDFMLAWPAIALLKKQYPDSVITALVPDYTRQIAERCPWIDKLLIDNKQPSFFKDITQLARELAHHRFDFSVSLFSETRTSLALLLAHVPKRFGPASKFAQLFLNRRLAQRRSRSLKPEYEYNLDLARYCITDNGATPVNGLNPPYLSVDSARTGQIKNNFINSNNIDRNSKLVAIHPGCGGSANNLTLEQYSELAYAINQCEKAFFVITAGPDELELANTLSSLIGNIRHMVYHSTGGLAEFADFLTIFDIYISGSTGVLHIAGALDIPTAAFYTRRRSATALRWQTLNSQSNRLAFSPPEAADEEDMSSIDIGSAAHSICQRLNQAS